MNHSKQIFGAVALLTASLIASEAQLIISEVHSGGSGNGTYAADWFEIKNIGLAPINLTGWKVDDSSASFAASVAMRGVTSLLPGQIAIFLEGNATGTTDASINAAFVTAWFGAGAPLGLTLGNYGGSGIGLSTTGDGVTLFDSIGVEVARVTIGVATAGFTFDNAAGLTHPVVVSQLSSVGINNAFTSFNGSEVGSPGVVPEPTTMALGVLGGLALFFRQRLVARQ